MDDSKAARLVSAVSPEPTEVQREMAAYADELGFPIVGPDAGAVLRTLARLTDADRVFEFGSGFGYSASWFLRGGAGHVVLTEFDADELEAARDFLGRAGCADRATFEHGDAVAIVEDYDGPFDVVLVDHQKHRYAEAFERVRGKVRPGGVVVADNLTSPVDLGALLAYVEGEAGRPTDEMTGGIADYLDAVGDDPAFETVVIPVEEGLAVSVRVD